MKIPQIKMVPIGSLTPAPKNPRTISDPRFKTLCRGMEDCPGLFTVRPCLCSDRTGKPVIYAGNMRYRAAQTLGWKGVPAIIETLTEAEERQRTVRDNVELGEWNMEALANEWDKEELEDWGVELDWKDPIEEAPGQDDIPESAPAICKRGQIWKLGEHRVMCGDSTSASDVALLMGGKAATLCFTDPPYGVGIGKKNAFLDTVSKGGRNHDNLCMDDMKPEKLGEMLLSVFTVWRPLFADDCSVFVCSAQGGGLCMMMMMMMQKAGLEVRHIINWVKNGPTFSMGRLDYDYQHEPILFTWKKTHKRKKEGQFQTSLWAVNKPMANKEHPTMKPVELPENAILNHTDTGDIVCDPFLGSGTTLIAAEKQGRTCYGMEISPHYCDVIIARWEKFTGKKAELYRKAISACTKLNLN